MFSGIRAYRAAMPEARALMRKAMWANIRKGGSRIYRANRGKIATVGAVGGFTAVGQNQKINRKYPTLAEGARYSALVSGAIGLQGGLAKFARKRIELPHAKNLRLLAQAGRKLTRATALKTKLERVSSKVLGRAQALESAVKEAESAWIGAKNAPILNVPHADSLKAVYERAKTASASYTKKLQPYLAKKKLAQDTIDGLTKDQGVLKHANEKVWQPLMNSTAKWMHRGSLGIAGLIGYGGYQTYKHGQRRRELRKRLQPRTD